MRSLTNPVRGGTRDFRLPSFRRINLGRDGSASIRLSIPAGGQRLQAILSGWRLSVQSVSRGDGHPLRAKERVLPTPSTSEEGTAPGIRSGISRVQLS